VRFKSDRASGTAPPSRAAPAPRRTRCSPSPRPPLGEWLWRARWAVAARAPSFSEPIALRIRRGVPIPHSLIRPRTAPTSAPLSGAPRRPPGPPSQSSIMMDGSQVERPLRRVRTARFLRG